MTMPYSVALRWQLQSFSLVIALLALLATQHATAEPIEEQIETQRAMVYGVIKIGDRYKSQGKIDKALEAYEDVVKIGTLWVETRPDDSEWQQVLLVASGRICDVQVGQRQYVDAVKACEKYRAVAQYLAEADPGSVKWQRSLAKAHRKIGDAQYAAFKDAHSEGAEDKKVRDPNYSAALESFSESLAITKRLAQADPEDVALQQDLYWTLLSFAGTRLQKDRNAALNVYLDALAVAERGFRLNPKESDWLILMFGAQTWIGRVHMYMASDKGRGSKRWGARHLQVALESFVDALNTADRLAETDPSKAISERLLDRPQSKIAFLAGLPMIAADFDKDVARGDHAEALRAYKIALAYSEREAANMTKDAPDQANWQSKTALFYRRLGDILKVKGDSEAALGAYRDSVAISRRLTGGEFGTASRDLTRVTEDAMPSWRRDIAEGQTKIAAILVSKRQRGEAQKALQEARAIVQDLKMQSPPKSLRISELDEQIAKLERKLN